MHVRGCGMRIDVCGCVGQEDAFHGKVNEIVMHLACVPNFLRKWMMDQNGTQVKADALYEKDGANAGCLAYVDNFLRNYIADEMDIYGLVFPR